MWIHAEGDDLEAYIFQFEKKEDETSQEISSLIKELGKIIS